MLNDEFKEIIKTPKKTKLKSSPGYNVRIILKGEHVKNHKVKY